jgi:DNA-binding transcriptional LysR family regulator
VFLAAARSGTLASAGIRLGMDPATVGRRIARLESSYKATLFIRSKAGLQLTVAGARLLETGARAEAAMEAASVDHPDLVAGTVRISVAEGFGTTLIAPALAALRAERPHLVVELAASSGFLSTSRREVDMAVTLSAPEGARVVVEPLTPYQLALYAAPAYVAAKGAPLTTGDLSRHDIVGYIGDLIYAPELRYLDAVSPGLTPGLASSSIRAQREMINGGGGIGVLPCFMADGLVRVMDQILLERRFWLSTHRDVYATARIKAVRNWVRDLCKVHSATLSPFVAGGRTPKTP